MAAQIDNVLKHPRQFFVGGTWIQASSDDTIDVISPANEQIFLRVAMAREADINRAVSAARDAFDNGPWPRMSPGERAAYLRKIWAAIERRRDELARVQTSEMGIIYAMAQYFADGGLWNYYASLAETFPFEERHVPSAGGEVGLLVREPVGVVGAIIPWNGPFVMLTVKCAPALLAGCTIVVKASPEAPAEAYLLAEIIEEVGLPPGVFNFIMADRDVSELLVRHPDVDKITFTGSTFAGSRIGSICGERIARCTLELGGKSPALILDDYDVDLAARTLAKNSALMTGQVCAQLTRIIVGRRRHDDLVEALASRFGATVVGDPFDPSTEMGPVATRQQRERIENYIAQGKSGGATLALGGGRPNHLDCGFYLEPTVFGNVDNNMRIAREEIFGPVLCVIPADSEAEAIRIANDSRYGLNASVFTNDVGHARRVARELRTGTVGHNSTRGDFLIGFGGFKQSGIGREGGVEGLRPFLETKTIILDGEPDLAG